MDTALEILWLLAQGAWHVLANTVLPLWIAVLGAGVCLFAVNLVVAQPRDERCHVGVSTRVVALGMAIPIFAVGGAGVIWFLERIA